MMQASELKSCPFCGANETRISQATTLLDSLTIYSVECLECGAEIADDESQFAADLHWNTRAPDEQAKSGGSVEASDVWASAAKVWSACNTVSEGDRKASAIIEQAIRDAIAEDRRGRTFTVSELDKARVEGMERAAVIAEHPDRLDGPAYSCCERTVDDIVATIRAAKARDLLTSEAQADGFYDIARGADHAK